MTHYFANILQDAVAVYGAKNLKLAESELVALTTVT